MITLDDPRPRAELDAARNRRPRRAVPGRRGRGRELTLEVGPFVFEELEML